MKPDTHSFYVTAVERAVDEVTQIYRNTPEHVQPEALVTELYLRLE